MSFIYYNAIIYDLYLEIQKQPVIRKVFLSSLLRQIIPLQLPPLSAVSRHHLRPRSQATVSSFQAYSSTLLILCSNDFALLLPSSYYLLQMSGISISSSSSTASSDLLSSCSLTSSLSLLLSISLRLLDGFHRDGREPSRRRVGRKSVPQPHPVANV